ncbi:MAG: hypothetical protein ACI4CE_07505 [Methanomethylophilus alvi]
MAYEQPSAVPKRNTLDRTGERTVSEEGLAEMRPSVARAVRSLRDRMPAVRPNGIFRHPSDWTQEEIDFIADCLKQNIPIYTIANMVHCEKHTLSTMIAKNPELNQLKLEKYENLLDEAEYQADRLMKQGNSSLVIYVLQTLGRKRGWTTEDTGSGDRDERSRIVMGLIPKEDVEKAEAEVREVRRADPNPAERMVQTMTDPATMAAMEGMVNEEVDRRMNVVEAEAVSVSPTAGHPDTESETVTDLVEQQDAAQYGAIGAGTANQGMGTEPDPWADGADSMFFQ